MRNGVYPFCEDRSIDVEDIGIVAHGELDHGVLCQWQGLMGV